jgi:universal stress protein A
MVFLGKILVTTDLSEFSAAAFEYAATASIFFDADITLLYVYEGTPAGRSKPHGEHEPRGHAHHTEEEALKALKAFIQDTITSGLHVTPVVRCGTPAEEIIRFAEQEGVDLIVIATHGRTGLRHIMMGSVAERIVRLSSIPVLSVKPGPLRERILKDEDVESDLHLRP